MPVNPKTAAMIATIRKIKAQRSIVLFSKVGPTYQPDVSNIGGRLARRYGVLPCQSFLISRRSAYWPVIGVETSSLLQPQMTVVTTRIGHLGGLKTELQPPRHGRKDAQTLAERSSFPRSEEHTSELQSPCNLVCRLLL